MSEFNHFDRDGKAHMVDVSEKEPTRRYAVARAHVHLGADLLRKVLEGGTRKGDVLGIARLAGIAAAKRTGDLIPLAHPLSIHHAALELVPEEDGERLRIVARVTAFERTGVEMEAMTMASVAALTVYDMCKGHDKSIRIGSIVLLEKRGGKSGHYVDTEALR